MTAAAKLCMSCHKQPATIEKKDAKGRVKRLCTRCGTKTNTSPYAGKKKARTP